MIDPAMCRPGRLDKLLYVDLPTADERAEIVATLTRAIALQGGDATRERLFAMVKDRAEGYSGADLSSLVREAGVVALRRALGTLGTDEDDGTDDEDSEVQITVEDFELALASVQPSVSVAQRRRYEALRTKFAGLPVRAGKEEDEKRVDGGESLKA
jgi:ribosome biogenesis ATPase